MKRSKSSRLTNRDVAVLRDLAELRVLSMTQLRALHFPSPQTARRRVRELVQEGLLETRYRDKGRCRGAPERVVFLTPKGTRRILPDANGGIQELRGRTEHQLLVNTFRIHLRHLERNVPALRFEFLSENSLLGPQGDGGQPFIADEVVIGESTRRFIPDGVVLLRDDERETSALLFLEADRGTESLESRRNPFNTVKGKIAYYQAYFYSGRYQRYGELWGEGFRGFRLLLLTDGKQRAEAIRRLLEQQENVDFVWVTDRADIAERGLEGRIWTRGSSEQRYSILGSVSVGDIPPLEVR